ncbi:hypothetical protein ACFTOW_14100 [Lacimonas salitolerans]|uniref:Tyrosine specific protein phosphatases domain-containing protein n=1 Tax=Lacimonas salitolerans TaxID=1323750 RepID=A0ABW4EH70_9RHOB
MRQDLIDLHSDSSVRAICPHPRGGHVITMGFPGLEIDFRGQALINPDRIDATLNHAMTAGMRLLIILTQPDELPQDAIAMLRRAVRARGLRAIALPIEDYSVPGLAFMRAWKRLSPALGPIFASGASVGMSCHHGAGRSGVVAAMHLIDAGCAPTQAVAKLRRQFPETVENDHQHGWLMDYARAVRINSVG